MILVTSSLGGSTVIVGTIVLVNDTVSTGVGVAKGCEISVRVTGVVVSAKEGTEISTVSVSGLDTVVVGRLVTGNDSVVVGVDCVVIGVSSSAIRVEVTGCVTVAVGVAATVTLGRDSIVAGSSASGETVGDGVSLTTISFVKIVVVRMSVVVGVNVASTVTVIGFGTVSVGVSAAESVGVMISVSANISPKPVWVLVRSTVSVNETVSVEVMTSFTGVVRLDVGVGVDSVGCKTDEAASGNVLKICWKSRLRISKPRSNWLILLPAKFRGISIALLHHDEIDGW